jgi:hypothetical protein
MMTGTPAGQEETHLGAGQLSPDPQQESSPMNPAALLLTASALWALITNPALAQFGIQPAIGLPTKFDLLNQSMEQLLNDGYTIVSNGGQGSVILRADKKWVFCLLDTTSDPRTHRTSSVCAALN